MKKASNEAVVSAAQEVAKCHKNKENCVKNTKRAKTNLHRAEDAECAADKALSVAHEKQQEVLRSYR